MASLQIPKIYIPGFQAIADLENDRIQEIIGFLKEVPVGTGQEHFQRLFNEKFDDLKSSLIALTLFSLVAIQSYDEEKIEPNVLANELADSYSSQVSGNPSSFIQRLKENLTTLLGGLMSLYYSHKVFNLLRENNKAFISSHIVSDIRLIFNDDILDRKRYSVILHRLKLKVIENEEQQEYFFSLDSNDLKELKKQIERAEEKERIIRDQYGKSIEFINITE